MIWAGLISLANKTLGQLYIGQDFVTSTAAICSHFLLTSISRAMNKGNHMTFVLCCDENDSAPLFDWHMQAG